MAGSWANGQVDTFDFVYGTRHTSSAGVQIFTEDSTALKNAAIHTVHFKSDKAVV